MADPQEQRWRRVVCALYPKHAIRMQVPAPRNHHMRRALSGQWFRERPKTPGLRATLKLKSARKFTWFHQKVRYGWTITGQFPSAAR